MQSIKKILFRNFLSLKICYGYIENCVAYITFILQFSICITARQCHLTNAVIHIKTDLKIKKIKREMVPQKAEYFQPDYNNFKRYRYINLSVHAVESAVVAQLAEHLPQEQASNRTSGFEIFTRIPVTAPTELRLVTK